MVFISLTTAIAILIFVLILFLRSLSYKDLIPRDIDKKTHKLYFLYPMVGLFLEKTGLEKRLENKSELNKKIQAINFSDHNKVQVKLYWYQKSSVILLIILACSCLSLIVSIQSVFTESKSFSGYLVRPEEKEGDKEIRLSYRMEGDQANGEYYEDDIVIKNKARIYTDDEWNDLLKKVIPYLENEMLGENQDADHVDMKLNFIKEIPGTGIKLEWIPENYRLISSNGDLNNRDMSDKKIKTLVTTVLKYEDRRVEHKIPITIYPLKLSKRELLHKEVLKALDRTEQETGGQKEWHLPSRVGDYHIIWKIPVSRSGSSLLILGLFASILIWIYRDREVDKKMKQRSNQMLHDYPEIINKFNLLVNAGMTIRQAWTKISEDYRKKSVKDKDYVRYAYEEMLLTLNELKLGVAEINAYESFGKRTGQPSYMRFSSILVQNLKKGNKSMVDLLSREAVEAFQERKDNTKRLGEEASTKLLGPMITLLLIVLIIIMIPAFISFQL